MRAVFNVADQYTELVNWLMIMARMLCSCLGHLSRMCHRLAHYISVEFSGETTRLRSERFPFFKR